MILSGDKNNLLTPITSSPVFYRHFHYDQTRLSPALHLSLSLFSTLKRFGCLRKFQNLNHPKNHEYDGEINETWDNYFSGMA